MELKFNCAIGKIGSNLKIGKLESKVGLTKNLENNSKYSDGHHI
jgi:hypothetical protein